ncbi:MAG: DUF5667 domain-containing protein [Candidatus Woesebacteria bacterium]|nr:DUF5667 domain-containing protein [Candidatus Woesebacteria bacterium]
MNIKKILILVLFFFLLAIIAPKTSKAVDLQEVLTSENSIIVKIQEGIEYFFAFKIENKIAVLEKHAEKRLAMAQGYADSENNERVQNLLQNYLQIKDKQNNLLGKTNNGDVLGVVAERTIEQQKTMEEIKTKSSGDLKQVVVKTQEQVVNQVAQRVIETNGTGGQTEFFNKVEHVWAPGTGPGGVSGVVIEGGSMQFAPGTSAGGNAGSDIKTVEIKTGGFSNDEAPVNNSGSNLAPGTTQDGTGGNTIDPGGVNQGSPGTGTTNVIDP